MATQECFSTQWHEVVSFALYMVFLGDLFFRAGTFTGMVADYFISDEEVSETLTDVEKRLVVLRRRLTKCCRDWGMGRGQAEADGAARARSARLDFSHLP
jgi:hypothetical protein